MSHKLTLMVALRPLSPSVELAKFKLSQSMPKMDRILVVGEGKVQVGKGHQEG